MSVCIYVRTATSNSKYAFHLHSLHVIGASMMAKTHHGVISSSLEGILKNCPILFGLKLREMAIGRQVQNKCHLLKAAQ